MSPAKPVRVGINGMGQLYLRHALAVPAVAVVAVNDVIVAV